MKRRGGRVRWFTSDPRPILRFIAMMIGIALFYGAIGVAAIAALTIGGYFRP